MKQPASGRRSCFLPLLLPLALTACGKGDGKGDPFVETIATTFEAECLRTLPTEGEAARQRRQLCACTIQKIRTSGIKASDGDKANQDRIHAAQQACRTQVLGSGR